MERNRIYRRYQRRAHIGRKKRILKNLKMTNCPDCFGRLSKGKIHCSCPLCSAKYYESPSISDTRKINKMATRINERWDMIDSIIYSKDNYMV